MEVSKNRAWLLTALTLYTAASLLHFAHNAEYLRDYPNLPDWLDRSSIYATWLALASLGVAGYVLLRSGRELTGLALTAIYAAFGFDGFLHYTRAPMAAHTTMMNVTIWAEAAAALVLLCVVLMQFIARVPRSA